MEITLVVDAYNAINRIPKTRKEMKKGLYFARKAIIAISREYARSSGYITNLRVVFDGKDQYKNLEALYGIKDGIQVFSATGAGDDKIIETIKKYSQKGRVVLASNDNYVRNNARVYGASLIYVEELIGQYSREKGDKKKNKTGRTSIIEKHINRTLQDKINKEYKKELGL